MKIGHELKKLPDRTCIRTYCIFKSKDIYLFTCMYFFKGLSHFQFHLTAPGIHYTLRDRGRGKDMENGKLWWEIADSIIYTFP